MFALDLLQQYQSINGSLLAAGKIYVYNLGRTQLATVYGDHNGATPIANPVVLDDQGMAEIYLNDAFNYTIVVYDAYGQEQFSRDIYPRGMGNGESIGTQLYEGVDPIVVNNDLYAISANTSKFGVEEPLYFVQDDAERVVIGFSGTLPVAEGTMVESALGYQDGKITGYNGSAFSAGNSYEEGSYIDINGNTISVTGLTPVPADTASTGLVASVSADITGMIPDTSDMATQTWVNEQGYLTGVDLTPYQTTADMSGYLKTGDSAKFYTTANESGFINSDAISSMATTGFVAGVSADITAMIPTALTGDYLTKESADTLYQPIGNYQTAGNYQSALTFNYTNDNEISGINGSAIAGQEVVDDYELVEGNGIQITDDPNAHTTTISVSGDYATNTQLQNVSADITALIPTALTGEYLDKASADTLYYPLTGNPSGFITGVDLTPYQLTADMTAYQPTGDYLTIADSANFYTTANESGFLTAVPGTYLQNTDLGINDNKITAISGVEVGCGGDSNVTTDMATFTVAPNTAGVPVNISYYTSTPVQELATTIMPQDFAMSNSRLILSSDANGINYSAGQIVNVEVAPNSIYELHLCYVNGNATAAATTGDQGRIAVDYGSLSGNYSAVITAAPGTYTALALTTNYYNESTQTAGINKVELYEPNSALGFNVKIDNPAEFAKYSDPKVEFTGTTKFIVGTGNVANSNSMAVGYYNSASYEAISLGQYNTASDYDVAIGDNNSALGYYSVAIGGTNDAENTAVAIGGYNSASQNSFAQGYYNSASYGSLAQGEYNTARDNYAMAQGYHNSAQNYSLTQGRNNTATNNSLAQGGYNSAQNYSIVQGEYNTAKNYSQAFGGYTKATNSGMAIGSYNAKEDGAFVVGNGTWQQRKDAFWIDHNGNVSAAGKISANGVELGTIPNTYLQNTDLTTEDGKVTAISGIPLSAGGEQVQSDWTVTAVDSPAYILNKPTEKNLVAGVNVTITESDDDVTIETTEIASGLQLVAGHGVTLTVSGTNVVAAVDETVLFETTATNGVGVCNLSESLKHFEKIRVLASRGWPGPATVDNTVGGFPGPWSEWETDGISADGRDYNAISPFIFEANNWKNSVYTANDTYTTLTWKKGIQKDMASTAAGSTANSFTACVGIKKIIGVNRVS